MPNPYEPPRIPSDRTRRGRRGQPLLVKYGVLIIVLGTFGPLLLLACAGLLSSRP